MRRLFALAMLACATLAQPALAQSQISPSAYIDASGRAAAVRPSAPLPVVETPYAVPASRFNYAGATGGITTTTAAAINAAAGATLRSYVVACQFFNSAATASEVEIRDGSTVIWRGYVPASMTASSNVIFPVPLRGSLNTAMNIAVLTTATATRVSCQGYTSTQ